MDANHNESCGVCHQVHCTCRTTNRDILDGTGNGSARVSMPEARKAAKPPEGYRVQEGAEGGAHKYYWVAMDGIELEHRTRLKAIAALQAHADKQRAIGRAEATKTLAKVLQGAASAAGKAGDIVTQHFALSLAQTLLAGEMDNLSGGAEA